MIGGDHIRNLLEYQREFGFRGVFEIVMQRKRDVMRIHAGPDGAPVLCRRGTPDFPTLRACLSRQVSWPKVNTDSPRILDSGAHVGYSTLSLLRQYPSAQIVSLEPANDNFKLLKANCMHFRNITPIHGALMPSPGQVELIDPNVTNWAYQFEYAAENRNSAVPAHSVPSIMDKFGWAGIDILKMDIEGTEKEIFEAGNVAEWSSKVGVFVIELHDRLKPGCREAVERAIGHQTIQHTLGEYDVYQTREV